MGILYNFDKGLRNLFKVSTVNILVLLCLILILTITYLNTGSLELFTIDNNYLSEFINKYIENINNTTDFKKTLATQEQKINILADQVINLINTQK